MTKNLVSNMSENNFFPSKEKKTYFEFILHYYYINEKVKVISISRKYMTKKIT